MRFHRIAPLLALLAVLPLFAPTAVLFAVGAPVPTTIDSAGAVGAFTSLVVVGGNPAIAYYDITNGNLKYVRATNASGTAWGVTRIADSSANNVGSYASMAVVNGLPAISYFDSTLVVLKYVQATNATGTAWGTPVNLGAGGAGSLVVVNGNPAISYSNGTSLLYVRANDANGATWGAPVTVDTGSYFHISQVVVNGNPAISYYDSTNGDLKYVRASDASGTTWGAPVTVASANDTGLYTSLLVVNGNPAISFVDLTTGNLRFARSPDVNGATWGKSSISTADSSGVAGGNTSMVIAGGNPAISYYDAINGTLRYVRATDANGTNWAAPNDWDTGSVGQYASLAIVNGTPAISYYDNSNADLKYVRSSNPTPITLTDASGARASDGSVTLTWTTASEVGVQGFTVLRGTTAARSDAVALPAGFVPATGDGATGATYTWRDSAAPADATYWLAVQNSDGSTDEYGPITPTIEPAANVQIFLPLIQQ